MLLKIDKKMEKVVALLQNHLPGFFPGLLAAGGLRTFVAAFLRRHPYFAVAVEAASGLFVALKMMLQFYEWWVRMRTWFKGKERVVTLKDTAAVSTTDRLRPESAVAGSVEQSMTMARCQVLVGYSDKDSFMALGCGIRLDEDWLVVPEHVRCAMIGHTLAMRGVNGMKCDLPMDESEWKLLATDMMAVRLSSKKFSVVGAGVAKLAPLIPEDKAGSYVSICGPSDKGTTGFLRHSTAAFGMVTYSGTTLSGYSGAGYFTGQGGHMLAGIHVHGGAVNGGYSASFLFCELRQMQRVKNEDSQAWLETIKKSKKATITIDPGWHDLDEVRMRYRGRYAIVQRESLEKTFGANWMEELMEGWESPSYGDKESGLVSISEPSGEEKVTPESGASVVATQSPGLVEELVKALTHREFKKFRGLLHAAETKGSKPQEQQ